jgi:L,D-peptidoglycan transpeptidase YkuD (ErfK/YbiS/YcfS/YnhG family)
VPVRAVVVALMAGLVACGSPSAERAGQPGDTGTPATPAPSAATTTVTTATTVAPTLAAGPTATTGASAGAVSTAPRPATTAAPATTPAAPSQLAQAGSAGQAVVVTAGAYGDTSATFTAWSRTADGWERAFGPWTARVGTKGLAPPGAKREGDGRTPSGVYGFDFFFGVDPDPGVQFPYRRVTSGDIVWDDDPASPRYNQWVDLREADAGAEPEAMYQPTAYQHGAVIAYNTARTPGMGSAIFLHASTGGPTAGCVSLPMTQLVAVLRWLDPGRSPRIILGVEG